MDIKNLKNNKVNKIVALGISTGGPRALQSVIPKLPKDLAAPVIIVQHMPPGFTKSLANRLNELSEVDVFEAENNMPLLNGQCYISPGDKHITIANVAPGKYVIKLLDTPKRGPHRPSVDVMFESLRDIRIRNIICIVMTGMGKDGTEGLKNLKKVKKVYTITQDQKTCVVYGMPKSIVKEELSDEEQPLENISKSIVKRLEEM